MEGYAALDKDMQQHVHEWDVHRLELEQLMELGPKSKNIHSFEARHDACVLLIAEAFR